MLVCLLGPRHGADAVIDVMYVTEKRPFEPFADYPPLGSRVQAVVMPYPPSGQLRLSTRHADVSEALKKAIRR